MSYRDVVRAVRQTPRELSLLRAKLMLEPLCETLGVEEVPCPACRGTGWLSRRLLRHCPLCCGFREVPDRLADWFRARAGGAGPRRREVCRVRSGHPASAGSRPVAERCGRLAEVRFRTHLPAP